MWLRCMRALSAVSLSILALGSLSSACQHEVTSPDVGADSVHPDLVCNRQVASAVEIHGSAFSPMPVQVLEEPATLVLPSVTLAKAQDIAGTEQTGVTLVVSGSPADANAARLSWQSE